MDGIVTISNEREKKTAENLAEQHRNPFRRRKEHAEGQDTLLIFTLDNIPNLTVGINAPDGGGMNRVGGTVENQSCREEKSHCY